MPHDSTPDPLLAILETLKKLEEHMAALRKVFVPENDPRRAPFGKSLEKL